MAMTDHPLTPAALVAAIDQALAEINNRARYLRVVREVQLAQTWESAADLLRAAQSLLRQQGEALEMLDALSRILAQMPCDSIPNVEDYGLCRTCQAGEILYHARRLLTTSPESAALSTPVREETAEDGA